MTLTREERSALKADIIKALDRKLNETKDQVESLKLDHMKELQSSAREQIKHFSSSEHGISASESKQLIKDTLEKERNA